jgi:hypothetical protein
MAPRTIFVEVNAALDRRVWRRAHKSRVKENASAVLSSSDGSETRRIRPPRHAPTACRCPSLRFRRALVYLDHVEVSVPPFEPLRELVRVSAHGNEFVADLCLTHLQVPVCVCVCVCVCDLNPSSSTLSLTTCGNCRGELQHRRGMWSFQRVIVWRWREGHGENAHTLA